MVKSFAGQLLTFFVALNLSNRYIALALTCWSCTRNFTSELVLTIAYALGIVREARKCFNFFSSNTAFRAECRERIRS